MLVHCTPAALLFKFDNMYLYFSIYSREWALHKGKSEMGEISGDVNFQDRSLRKQGRWYS